MSDDSDLVRDETGPHPAGREFQKVLGAVRRAFQMASHLAVGQPGTTRVAVVSRRGQLIASAPLHSPSQARFVLDQLRPLGFVERRSTAAIRKHGCDLLLVHAGADRDAQRIVRASDAQRWPPENEEPAAASAPEQASAPRWPRRWRGRR
jgi:hypothetical protein